MFKKESLKLKKKMFTKEYLKKLLLFDIETVAKYSSFDQFLENESKLANLWLDKAKKKNYYEKEKFNDLTDKDDFIYTKYSSLHPEFSKICSISILKFIENVDESLTTKIKTLTLDGINEKDLLTRFSIALNTNIGMIICGHNISGFDIPFINKRLLINGLPLPTLLNFYNKKPWEINILDTMTMWKFNGTDMVSLDLLCTSLGIISPKEEDVSGMDINKLYYNNEFNIIKKYNERDVVCLSNVLLRLNEIG